mmetsp:Transcript_7029/g.10328  ORF Transcript_7029/g.10328 Transcript_7029/m.10328 type:complete len:429 (+) Transcript_7029:66-1352(+)
MWFIINYLFGNENTKRDTVNKNELQISDDNITLKHGNTFKQIQAGSDHSLILTTKGSVFSWGLNSDGQCGLGSTHPKHVVNPSPILSFESLLNNNETITHISAGGHHNLALTSLGSLYSWGRNEYGQCGLGLSQRKILTPTKISKFDELLDYGESITHISTGSFHCLALSNKGTIFCWGSNSDGQCGLSDSLLNSPTKLALDDLGIDEFIVSLFTGNNHSLALSNCGSVFCWGSNDSGQCGVDLSHKKVRPMKIPFFEVLSDKIIQIYAGGYHSFSLDSRGHLYCWGSNNKGQCGIQGHCDVLSTPHHLVRFDHLLSSNEYISQVVVGDCHSVVLTSAGTVYSWGWNNKGQCGFDSNVEEILYPTKVQKLDPSVDKIIQLYAGSYHTLALSSSDSVYCWGWNDKGQCGLVFSLENVFCPSKISSFDQI